MAMMMTMSDDAKEYKCRLIDLSLDSIAPFPLFLVMVMVMEMGMMMIMRRAAGGATSVGWQEGHGADDKPTPNPWQASTSWTHSELEKYNWEQRRDIVWWSKRNTIGSGGEIQFDDTKEIQLGAEEKYSLMIQEKSEKNYSGAPKVQIYLILWSWPTIFWGWYFFGTNRPPLYVYTCPNVLN